MRKRKEILIDLIQLNQDIPQLIHELSEYEWDCDEPLVTIVREDVINILDKYLKGEITSNVLEDWGNAVECRDDLAVDDDLLLEAINKIANPVLFGGISMGNISKIKNTIRSF